MALLNYATKEIIIKIVYYGPGMSGKTTNIQYLHSVLNPKTRGKLLSLATEADRTLFFDFLPVESGKIRDFSIRFQLYTVPGQVWYNATRKLILRGADAIVFVADSQSEMMEQNIESLKNMHENLVAYNINPNDIPLILQYNKRDIPNILSIDELNKNLNKNKKYEYIESVAVDGTGVEDTFQRISKLVLQGITKKHKIEVQPAEELVKTIEPETSHEEMILTKPIPEEPVPEIPIIESSRYEYPKTEQATFEVTHEIPEVKEEPIQTVAEEKVTIPEEVIIKESREVPPILAEKLDMIINGIKDMKDVKDIKDISQTLKELKNIASNLHLETKEMKKEQKEITVMLRDIRNNFEKIKTKKSWFRSS